MVSAIPVMMDVVEEHLDEIGFLWSQRERALEAPGVRPADLVDGVEGRLVAHLDALELEDARLLQRLLERAVAEGAPGKIAGALLALAEKPGDAVIWQGLGLPGSVEFAEHPLGLCRRDLGPMLARLLADPRYRVVALGAMYMRHQGVGAALTPLLKSGDQMVQVAALRSASLGGTEVRAAVEAAMGSPNPAVRDAALQSGLILGLRSAHLSAQLVVDKRGADLEVPLTVLAMSGEPGDLLRIAAAFEVPESRRAALWAAGISGRKSMAGRCLSLSDDESLGRLAGEAFSAITGLTIEGDYVLEERAEPEEPIPFEQEDLEADLVPPAEESLPLPDRDMLEAWWATAASRFDESIRYLAGEPWGPEAMRGLLRSGPMRRRHAIALELAVRSRGELRLETRSWVSEQLRYLSSLRVVNYGFDAPFTRLLQV